MPVKSIDVQKINKKIPRLHLRISDSDVCKNKYECRQREINGSERRKQKDKNKNYIMAIP